MKNIKFATALFWLPLVVLFLFSCEDKSEEHYKPGDWLKGSAWSVLREKGNYTIFLKGIELAGYKAMVEGKSILTIMAPDDISFKAYLNDRGYSDISDMDQGELNKLIGFHLLYYSYNKDRMVNFRPEGDLVSDENREKNAGLYYKFRTRSTNPVTQEVDYTTGLHRTVYHQERFLPVFSYRFFATKEIDAKYNYEYFYPGSTWTGTTGFNVSNASVNEYAIIADNGYIYTIDKVLTPLETIHTELKNREDYWVFLNLYDSYSEYAYDAALTKDYAKTLGTDSLFLHQHGTLPPIAMEWPVSDYRQIDNLASISYSVFAPSDRALNAFYEKYWELGEYDSLDDVDPLIIGHFMKQFVSAGSVVFPEQIKKGKVLNSDGTPFNFDPDAITDKAICVNGTFYGIDNLETPPIFASVIGPALRNKNNISYLYALDKSGLFNSFVSPNTSFISLMPTDTQMNESGIFLNSYTTGNVLEQEGESGWGAVGSTSLQQIVNMHTVNGESQLKTTGTKVYATQAPFSYLYVKNGTITTNAIFNNSIVPDYTGDIFVPFTEITNNGAPWSNGRAYSYGKTDGMFDVDHSEGLERALAISNDARYPYNSFVQLMKAANMISGTNIPLLIGARFIAFIPTSSAIQTALAADKIPGIVGGKISAAGVLTYKSINTAQLNRYLCSYFLRGSQNALTTYPYPGSTMKTGTYDDINMNKLTYTDRGSSLTVQSEGSSKVANVVSTYDYFPFAYTDGCFHLIDVTF